jgi:hypothetical protein
MKLLQYIGILVALTSPYLVGAGLLALWSPGLAALLAVTAVVGMAWVLSMGWAASMETRR